MSPLGGTLGGSPKKKIKARGVIVRMCDVSLPARDKIYMHILSIFLSRLFPITSKVHRVTCTLTRIDNYPEKSRWALDLAGKLKE